MAMRISLRFLWRDIQQGELNLLLAGIVIAVTSVTSITLFSERLQKALVAESNTFLAAELVLRSPSPVHASWLESKPAQTLRQAQTVQFPSMVFAGDEMFLASVKAVSHSYPLLGKLEISDRVFDVEKSDDGIKDEPIKVDGSPVAGEAWLDSRLLHLLNAKIGDQVWIGEKAFIIKHILAKEPDSGSGYWSLGPRILVSIDDLAATHVVQAGSRVEYRYLFSGDEKSLGNFQQFLKPLLQARHRLMTLEDSQPGLAQSLSRAENFLLLAGSLAVLLAAVAVAMAARRYSFRHFDEVALLKVLGARKNFLFGHILLPLLIVLAFGVLLGAGIGQGLQWGFLQIMREWLPASLPQASWRPYGIGFLTAFVCVIGFACPLLWQLIKISPLRVLRRDITGSDSLQKLSSLIAVASIFCLMWFFSKSLVIATYVFFGVALTALVTALISCLLLKSAKKIGASSGGIWRLALAGLQRNISHSIMQLVMFSLVFMLLLVSILVRTSLLNEWQQQLPEKTPNQFLINIAPYQVQKLQQFLSERVLQTAGMYPMVRGRLTHINGQLATVIISKQVDELYRELNLTWSKTLPEDNKIISGTWWKPNEKSPYKNADPKNLTLKSGVSIESGLAEKLNIKLGDSLSFSIGDQVLETEVVSLRALSWDRMRPNFYFIFEPGMLDDFPATYITSFYLPKEKNLFLNELLHEFPTLSIFSVDELIRRIQSMVKQVTQAIELVLMFILSAGLLVLIASVQASLDQRIQESTLLRSLGASRRLILGGLALEFILLGALAGLIAAMGAEVLTWSLQYFVFKTEHSVHLWPWLVGPLVSMVIVSVTGLIACGSVVRVPPWTLLKEQNA